MIYRSAGLCWQIVKSNYRFSHFSKLHHGGFRFVFAKSDLLFSVIIIVLTHDVYLLIITANHVQICTFYAAVLRLFAFT